MRRSFEATFGVMLGLGLLLIAGLLILFSVSSMKSISKEVASSSDRIVEDVSASLDDIVLRAAEDILVDRAKSQAHLVESRINGAMNVARTISQLMMGLKTKGASASGINRDRIIMLLKGIIASNSDFMGVYTCWERDRFDGNAYAYENLEGHDKSGRFIPYWFSDSLGNLSLHPQTHYESLQKDVNGVRLGEYYLAPRERSEECIIDPFVKKIHGEEQWCTSLVSPIIVDGEFYGVAGVDLTLDSIQSLAEMASKGLYDGSVQILFISNNGTVVADSKDRDHIGLKMGQCYPDSWDLESQYMYSTRPIIDNKNGIISVFFPLKIGRSTTPWMVNIILSEEVVTKEAHHIVAKMRKEMNDLISHSKKMTDQSIKNQLQIGGGVSIVVLILIIFLVLKEVKMMRNVTYKLELEVEERRQATDALRKSETNLAITLNSIGDAVIVTNIKGELTRMNPVAEKLTGWNLDQAKGKMLQEVFNIIDIKTGKTAPNPIDQVLKGELVGMNDDTLLISRDGTELRIADSCAPIRSDTGEISGVVFVFRDISEEYVLQEQLRHSQKMDAVGQLASGVAHDFNNMIGCIMGATELLGTRLHDDQEAWELYEMIIEAAERAAGLTSNLLSFASKQHAVFSTIDVHNTINDTVSLLKSSIDRRIKLKVNLAAEASLVIGDTLQLQSAFLNIGINASHAMPDGGSIEITTRTLEVDSLYCQGSSFDIEPGSYLEIEFRDTGCGISPESMPRIFEPFFTTKQQGNGTGLGLATVFGLVRQQKGAINVYSDVGVGTSFHILLPLAKTDTRVSPSPATQAVSGSGRILVIDDEEVIRKTTKTILEGLGYKVFLAQDGRQGLELFKKEYDSIDLVLLDMIMPEMNGRDCFAAMQKIVPDIKVVLSTGYTSEEYLEEMKAAGLCSIIRKPYSSITLSQVIHKILYD